MSERNFVFDPDELGEICGALVALHPPVHEVVPRLHAALAERYPTAVSPASGRWVASKAGGILGKVQFLFFSPREYLVIFGCPSGTQGLSGRYPRVRIHKYLLAGRIDSYDLETDDTDVSTMLPGTLAVLEKGHLRGMTISPGSWHLEYGRGAVLTTLPFAMVDTLLLSLELASVRRSATEFFALRRRAKRVRAVSSVPRPESAG